MTPSCKRPIIFPILGIRDPVGYLGIFPYRQLFGSTHLCYFRAIWRNYYKLRLQFLCTLNIAGHSFVKRLRNDLRCKFDNHVAVDFNSETANVSLYGIRGLTVPRLAQEFRLKCANEPLSRIIILEIGRNDLSSQSPKVVIRELFDLVDHNFPGAPRSKYCLTSSIT